jgi:hypothetical protein
MLLTDVWMLDGFFARHPPVDLLVAAYLGFKAPAATPTMTRRQANRANTEALAALPPRRNEKTKTLAQMPAFLRTPQQLEMIEGMKREWQAS